MYIRLTLIFIILINNIGNTFTQDLRGKNINDIELEHRSYDLNPYNIFQFKNNFGYFNEDEIVVINPVFANVQKFEHGRARIKYSEEGKWGYIDTLGNLVIDTAYEEADDFGINAIAIVRKNGKYGAIDKQGNTAIDFKYDFISYFLDPYITTAQFNGKNGIINSRGVELSEFKFDQVHAFVGGRLPVKNNESNLWGLVNEKGEWVMDYKYHAITNYSDGQFVVELNGKFGRIDTTGKLSVPIVYDWIGEFKNGFGPVKMNGKYGFITTENKSITPFKYDKTWFWMEDNLKYRVSKDGVHYLIDIKGVEHPFISR